MFWRDLLCMEERECSTAYGVQVYIRSTLYLYVAISHSIGL